MQEVASNRRGVATIACGALIVLVTTLCAACSDHPSNAGTGNATMQANTVDDKLALDTAAFNDHWGELQSFNAALMKRNAAVWREMVARGDDVFGIGVLYPAALELQSVVVTTRDGMAVASWVDFARPVSDYSARTFGMGQPGYGVLRSYPIDLASSQTELQVYWSRHGATQPALTMSPQDSDQLRGRFIEINLMDVTWRIVDWVLGSH